MFNTPHRLLSKSQVARSIQAVKASNLSVWDISDSDSLKEFNKDITLKIKKHKLTIVVVSQ
jgi:hypothetical protein